MITVDLRAEQEFQDVSRPRVARHVLLQLELQYYYPPFR